jgi:hypothetical protein
MSVEPAESRLARAMLGALPNVAPDPVTWAHESRIVLPGSGRSKHFSIEITPWLREPLLRSVEAAVRVVTLMKPVQSGGSVFGELMLMYWMIFGRGFLQYNWSNDKRAKERWSSRVESVLKANEIIWDRFKVEGVDRECDLGNVFFRMQGAFSEDNLDSDTVRLQINEEIHSWPDGHLKKASNRMTAVWDYKRLDVSNAGNKGDQLDNAFSTGTAQHWEVKCPGCGLYHRMRTRWEEKRPDLGGLRYDATKARLGHYHYNYNVLRPTIEFWMPCGFRVHNEDVMKRRELSLSGRYSDPTNPGAETSKRSYTYQAVSVDFIDWMQLIQDKHEALAARAVGDPTLWEKYKKERECVPHDPNDVPIVGLVTVVEGKRKSRAGLSGEKLRLAELDRQQGVIAKGEFPHWWILIRDVQFDAKLGKLRSLLVYEGKAETDQQVISILDDHKVKRWQTVADSGDDTTHVYAFCLQHGINAIKGGTEELYAHPNPQQGAPSIMRIYSPRDRCTRWSGLPRNTITSS